MPITGIRANSYCSMCIRERLECGHCIFLNSDRRSDDRRRSERPNNFLPIQQLDFYMKVDEAPSEEIPSLNLQAS